MKYEEIDDATPMNVTEAIEAMAAVLGDGMTADHTGSHFSCREADALALVLKMAGHEGAAVTWLTGHAFGDDDGDDVHPLRDEDDNPRLNVSWDEMQAHVRRYVEEEL